MSEIIKRGRELLLFINRKKARGVLSLSIKKNTERYRLKEYLCEAPYAAPVKSMTYRITLSSLLPIREITEEPFVLIKSDGEEEECFEGCTLTEKKEEITPDDYIRYTYMIESARRRKGGSCGD